MAENIRNKQQALLSLMEEMLDKTLHFTDLLDQYHENFKVFKQSFMDWHDQVEQEEEENAVEVEEFVAMSTDVDAQGISLPSVLRNPKPKLISQFSEDQALRQLPDREIIKCETRGVVHRDGDYHRDIPVRIFDPGIHALSHNCRGVVLEGLNLAGLWSKVKTAEEMSLRHLNRLQRLLSKMNEYSSRNILCSKWHEYQEPILFLDDAVERSCSVYHSYIALGSCQLVINEIDNYIATPLQPVKLFALYLSSPDNKESTISSLKEWLADSAIGNNSILRLIGGIICMHEQDYNEAMKHNYLIFIFSSYRNSSARHIEEIDFLVCLPFLRSLWLEGNPLCCVRCYRAQVFRYLFHLDKVKLYDKHISIREYWKRQIIIASRQKRPATLGFYSPAKDVAKEKGGNIKPRGESVKLKKEDSLSSMESDLRSSNFVFMQGAFNATSYEKQTGRSMVYQQCCTFDPPEGVLLSGELMKHSEHYINEETSLFLVACISLDENKIFVFDPGG